MIKFASRKFIVCIIVMIAGSVASYLGFLNYELVSLLLGVAGSYQASNVASKYCDHNKGKGDKSE